MLTKGMQQNDIAKSLDVSEATINFRCKSIGASTGWIEAFIVRATDRIGKGIRTAPRDALIADSVAETISGKAFGIHRTIDQLGAIVGPIAAFAILQVMDIHFVFLFSLVPGAVGVVILIYFVKEVAVKRYSSTKIGHLL